MFPSSMQAGKCLPQLIPPESRRKGCLLANKGLTGQKELSGRDGSSLPPARLRVVIDRVIPRAWQEDGIEADNGALHS